MGDASKTASVPAIEQRLARVFISYSRKDAAFAGRLETALKARRFEVFIDRHEISLFEEWWNRIETLITQADTVAFLLSPDSVASEFARKEVDCAASLNKRFAPIVYRPVDDKAVPEALAKLNYIFFDDEMKFEASADRLAQALRTDINWIRLHTEFGKAAGQWSQANRPSGLLLRSPALEDAERWIAARPEGAPAPTEETQTFIRQSRAVTTRRRNVLTGSLISGLIVALGLAGYAFYQRSQVQLQLDRANHESARASREAIEKQHQLDRANQALADAINNDLGLKPFENLTVRQRNSLWRLALADEGVKRDFASTLASSPEEIVRVAPGLLRIFRALGLERPSPTEAEQILTVAISAFADSQNRDPDALRALGQALQPLVAKLSNAQAEQALDPILRQIDQSKAPLPLLAMVQALQSLPVRLDDAQALQAFGAAMRQMDETHDSYAFQALQASASKLTQAQAQQALDPMIRQMVKPYNDDLVGVFQALAAKLSKPQARQALDLVLQQLGQTESPDAVRTLVQALPALRANLSQPQVQQTLDRVLQRMSKSEGNIQRLWPLVQALKTLAPDMSEAQAQKAFDYVFGQIAPAEKPENVVPAGAAKLKNAQVQQAPSEAAQALTAKLEHAEVPLALAEAAEALGAKLPEAQAQQALGTALRLIALTKDPAWILALAQVLQALPTKLTQAQAQTALDPVLQQIAETSDSTDLRTLAGAIQALAAKLTEAQAKQALGAALPLIALTKDPEMVRALAQALQALPTKLTQAQAQQALDPVLKQIDQRDPKENPYVFGALAEALKTLAPSLTERQTSQAVDLLLRQITHADHPDALHPLVEALVALLGKMTDLQVQQAINSVLARVEHSPTDQVPAEAFRALATKLTEAQARLALDLVLLRISETANPNALPIEDTDIVLWHTFGLHHLPRPEDHPVQTCVVCGFTLAPIGFFDQNAVIDLPSQTNEASCCAHCS